MATAVEVKAETLSFVPSPTVPVVGDLASVYTEAVPEERYNKITTAFELAFGSKPEFYARAPGRVNLIGEHIDYEGYGVLPMAIKQDTVVAIRRVPVAEGEAAKLVLGNVEADKYPTIEFAADPQQQVDVGNHSWANYFLSAYKGVFEYLSGAGGCDNVPEPCTLQVVVHGEVPTGSGLSSSAAIVCSSMLATLAALGKGDQLSKADIAESACKAERYVGVTSGGMDQAISMMGQAGVAMHVEFNPVRGLCVVLPPGATFVIAHSLAVSNKAETAPKRYNLRVVECRLAAVLLAIALGMDREEALGKIRTLLDVEPLIASKYDGRSDGSTAAAAVSEHLKEQYGMGELEEALGVKLTDMFAAEPGSVRALQVAEEDKYSFPLRKRAVHVYSEAQRVLDFRAVCEDKALSYAERLAKLGALMNDSHASCADLYGCSCTELDELVGVAREAGALGARLTGAGWGGCTVSLVKDEDVEGFLATLKEKFFQARIDNGTITADQLPEVLFATKPANGAALIKLAA